LWDGYAKEKGKREIEEEFRQRGPESIGSLRMKWARRWKESKGKSLAIFVVICKHLSIGLGQDKKR
jgi:hypothetical protein